MDVSKNPRVFEIDQRRIYHEVRKMGGMKEVKISVFNPTSIEVRGGIGFRL